MLARFKGVFSRIILVRSFRVRVFLLMLISGITIGIVMGQVILNNYEDRAVNLRISQLQNQLGIISNHLITYNYLKEPSSEVINAELNQLSNLYDGRVLIINNSFKVIKDTYGVSEGKLVVAEDVIRCFKGESTSRYIKKDGYIEMTIPIMDILESDDVDISNMQVRGVMLTAVSTDTITTTLDVLGRKVIIIEITMAITLFGLSIITSYYLTKPFKKVFDAINEVKAGYSDKTISVPDYAETADIVDAFNKVLARMRVLDESRDEFVSNVSHELKTPLTSMKVLADSLLALEDAPVELYREFMQDIASEIDRENEIINDLLSLVKLDKTNWDPNITSVDINEMIEILLKRLRPIARVKNIEVIFESDRNVIADVDKVKMSLAISNLVENSIKYNKEYGWVRVSLNSDHRMFTVRVEDSGIGIPKEELDHIFERFYRVDKSHSREIGGTGLGLSIARGIILMHRGSIDIESGQEGSTFTVSIPLNAGV